MYCVYSRRLRSPTALVPWSGCTRLLSTRRGVETFSCTIFILPRSAWKGYRTRHTTSPPPPPVRLRYRRTGPRVSIESVNRLVGACVFAHVGVGAVLRCEYVCWCARVRVVFFCSFVVVFFGFSIFSRPCFFFNFFPVCFRFFVVLRAANPLGSNEMVIRLF